MGTWREARSFLAVVAVVGIVAATTVASCGGGGGGSSNGDLCEQCGDSDGPCNAEGATVSGDDRPAGCGANDPCTVQLQCVRKADSGQRRCFPLDPTTGGLDFSYKCDGSRPALVPTSTPVPSATLTPSATATPVSTGPTATNPTPTVTATPGEDLDVTVTINIAADVEDENDLPSSFSVDVTYPPTKGSFLVDGAVDCGNLDDGVTVQDGGTGTLEIAFSGDSEGLTSIFLDCNFRQITGQTLTNADLDTSSNPSSLIVTIDDLD